MPREKFSQVLRTVNVMRNYQPTYGIRETAQNIKFFIVAHKPAFWFILKPLLPYILGLYLIDALITGYYYRTEPDNEFFIGSMIATYFYISLMISWYRLVILGPGNFVPMNPFRPTHNEMEYVFYSFFFVLSFFGVSFLTAFLLQPMGERLAGLSLIFSACLFSYFGFRLGFYFPSKAVDGDLSFAQSWTVTRGYFLKNVLAQLQVSLRPLLMIMAYVVIAGIVTMGILYSVLSGMAPGGDLDALVAPLLEQGRNPIELVDKAVVVLLSFALYTPIWAYFQPLLMVISATSVANYYMHAMQNRNDSVGVS